MLVAALMVIAGLALLVWSSDRFVAGASAIAWNLGVSPLVIGLTIVGFGTSAPEMLVSAIAAWQGNPNVGVGNAIGSNIANIALILGVTALVRRIDVHSRLLRLEMPILLAVTLGAYFLLLDRVLGRLDGALLLGTLLAIMAWLVHDALTGRRHDIMAGEFAGELPRHMPLGRAVLWFVVGLVVLLVSARMVVWGAVHIAQALGVSDLVIGLTIVAIGTSLPELSASITAALRGESDLAVGNVVGSNLFNLLAVMAMPGLITHTPVPAAVLWRDYPLMAALTLLLWLIAFSFVSRRPHINRAEGLLLVAGFAGYQYLLLHGNMTPGP